MSARRKWQGPDTESDGTAGGGHPLLFGFSPAKLFDPWPDGGGYPLTFMRWAFQTLGVTNPENVLHLCGGSIRQGVTVDIRPETNPTIVADCRNVPLDDSSFHWIMADPPYSKEWAESMYGTAEHYPAPGQIVKEMGRLLAPGGRCGILHFMVPQAPASLRFVNVWGISTGPGYNIRAWTVWEKRAPAEPLGI